MFSEFCSSKPFSLYVETHMREFDERKAHRQNLIHECTAFWKMSMRALADKHQCAMSSIDVLADDAESRIAALDRKLTVAQRLILQQSDIRWGTSVTNGALEHFHSSFTSFRTKLEKP